MDIFCNYKLYINVEMQCWKLLWNINEVFNIRDFNFTYKKKTLKFNPFRILVIHQLWVMTGKNVKITEFLGVKFG